MAAISRFTLTSCRQDAKSGGKIVIDGGKVQSVEETGVPQGTVVHVEELFYNVPARLAFLKKPATEKNHINNLVYRYALAYPKVRWSLRQDHRPVLRSSGNGNRREILAAMYGISSSKEMIEVSLEDRGRKVYGYISPVEFTRSNRREMTFFVNGRWVQDAGLSAALYKAYDQYLPPGRYPVSVLFVEIPPEEIDVNVHPAKSEVRFRYSSEIFSLVQRAVRRAFLAFTPMDPEVKDAWVNSSPTRIGSASAFGRNGPRWSQASSIDPAWDIAGSVRNDQPKSYNPSVQQSAILPDGMGLLRLIGKMKQGYLLVEGPDGLYLIDEKAARERILYEKLLRQVEEGGINSVPLFDSITISTTADVETLDEAISPLGFGVEPFGTDMVKFTKIAEILDIVDAEYIITVLLKEHQETNFSTPEEETEFLMKKLVYHAGSVFSTGSDRTQQNQLISTLQTCQSPRQTPDGRATMIHLSLDFMNRQFGRE